VKNFALDAQREMGHQDVLKAFRSGATMESVSKLLIFFLYAILN
jgi:hypothetical protein